MNILDPAFRYVPSHSTDIRKTFAKARKQQAQARSLHVVADTGSKTHIRIFEARRGK